MAERWRERDPQGREVVLGAERWGHITSGHPELADYEEHVRRAVGAPTSALPGREPDESGSTWKELGRADG